MPQPNARPCFSILAALLLAWPLQAQSTVWSVALDGSGDALDIQTAVDLAADGDILVVQPGGYPAFVVDGKGLSIFGLSNAAVFQTIPGVDDGPAVTIRNLSADQSVVLDGFTVFNSLVDVDANLDVQDCAGPVWLQDLFLDSYGAPSLRVTASSSVVLSDSLAQTNLMPTTPAGDFVPGPGLSAEAGSRIFGHAVTATGSHGVFFLTGMTPPNAPPSGGAGVQLVDSRGRFEGSDLGGGPGSAFDDDGCTVGGMGGPGLLVVRTPGGGPAGAVLLQTQADGGAGGFFDAGCAPPSLPGPDVELQAGSLTGLPGTSRRLALPGVATVGQDLTLAFTGEPGDTAWLFASTRAVPAIEAGPLVIHLDPDALLFLFAHPLPAGSGQVSLPVVALPPGIDGVVAPLQALFVDATGGHHVSGPRAVLVR